MNFWYFEKCSNILRCYEPKQGMYMDIIEKTKEYKMFKNLSGNRRLDKKHLKKLRESIEKDNKLNLHPIIVNKNLEIVDGQHRLEIAKELNLDVFYIKSDDVTDNHLIDSNVNQKSWEVENYIDYFCQKEKISDYIELKRLMDQTGLKVKALLGLIIGTLSIEMLTFLRTGKYRLPTNRQYLKNVDAYLDFITYVKDKKITPINMFTNHYFTKSYRWLLNTNGFDFQIFIKKLDLRWFDLKPQRGAEDWYKLLVSIYNFKNHNRLDEEYGKIN